MADELEARMRVQMLDVALAAGEQIVGTDHFMALLEQSVAKVGAKEAGAAGDQHAFATLVVSHPAPVVTPAEDCTSSQFRSCRSKTQNGTLIVDAGWVFAPEAIGLAAIRLAKTTAIVMLTSAARTRTFGFFMTAPDAGCRARLVQKSALLLGRAP